MVVGDSEEVSEAEEEAEGDSGITVIRTFAPSSDILKTKTFSCKNFGPLKCVLLDVSWICPCRLSSWMCPHGFVLLICRLGLVLLEYTLSDLSSWMLSKAAFVSFRLFHKGLS